MIKLILVKLSLSCLWDIWKRCLGGIYKYSLEFKNDVEEIEIWLREVLVFSGGWRRE